VAAQRIVNRKNLLSDQQFDAVDHASEPGPAGIRSRCFRPDTPG